MANVLKVLMIVCFGVSWPINIAKAWKAKSAKGRSVLFCFFILIGYIFGLCSKYILLLSGSPTPGYVWFFYILNAIMVMAGIIIYYRNKRLDSISE